jgi:hypothetical protein
MDDNEIETTAGARDPAKEVLALDPTRPHWTEVNLNGEVAMDRWTTHMERQEFEVDVMFPFTPGNLEKRKLVRRYTVERGQTIDVPRIYRNAIRTVRAGHVTGGLCPMLVLVNEEVPPLVHPAIARGSQDAIFTPRTVSAATSAEERLMNAARARREARS